MKKLTLLFAVFLLVTLNYSNTSFADGQNAREATDKSVPIPEDLGECFDALKKVGSPESVEDFKNTPEEDLAKYHFSIGMWMRNNWGLWNGSTLQDFFHKIGIFHPDDMSGIILTTFNRHLNGRDIALKELVASHVDYWRKNGIDDVMPLDAIIEDAEKTAFGKGVAAEAKSTDALLKDMESPDPEVRRVAVVQLGNSGDTDMSGKLSNMISDSDVGVRLEAIYALKKLGSPGYGLMIIPALHDKVLLVKRNASSVLSKDGDPATVEALVSMLDSSDKETILTVIPVLGASKSTTALRALVKMRKDEDPKVREAVRDSMDYAYQMIYYKDKPLVEFLHDEDPDVRACFAEYLGKHKSKDDIPSIAELLHDNDDNVVRAAIYSLGNMEHSQADEALRTFLEDKKNLRFHDDASTALGKRK